MIIIIIGNNNYDNHDDDDDDGDNVNGDNSYYYSFKIFPRFWLVKTRRIIHHNHAATVNQIWKEFCRIEPMTSKWRRKCSQLQVIERWPWKPGDEVELFW